MDYTGLLVKYRINCPLTDEDRENVLSKTTPATAQPPGIDGVLGISTSSLQIVDKFHYYKGFTLPFTLLGIGLCLWFYSAIWLIFLDDKWRAAAGAGAIWALVFVTALVLPSVGVLLWLVGKEKRTYTHYPIMLNRQNRMVYVFKHNGPNGVLAISWDKLFFCIGKAYGQARGEDYFRCVRAHVIDENDMVRETFDLGNSNYDLETIRRRWEYFRLYMEQGMDAVPPPPSIIRGSETLIESFRTASSWFGVVLAAIIFSPVILIQAPIRYLALLTSKTPVWPADVKAACQL
ncbi:DUF6708 domain-containing protein [Andreprevotia chitinilytica]|uniref:DUF6708 domain-containing protein n=1 Tax=Andreprevotia chitinilytica TaxID=396808 RepID=UPI0012EC478E|nr:DUF6708 domain-containing protein [Andreprevotia chitinilytica]